MVIQISYFDNLDIDQICTKFLALCNFIFIFCAFFLHFHGTLFYWTPDIISFLFCQAWYLFVNNNNNDNNTINNNNDREHHHNRISHHHGNRAAWHSKCNLNRICRHPIFCCRHPIFGLWVWPCCCHIIKKWSESVRMKFSCHWDKDCLFWPAAFVWKSSSSLFSTHCNWINNIKNLKKEKKERRKKKNKSATKTTNNYNKYQ